MTSENDDDSNDDRKSQDSIHDKSLDRLNSNRRSTALFNNEVTIRDIMNPNFESSQSIKEVSKHSEYHDKDNYKNVNSDKNDSEKEEFIKDEIVNNDMKRISSRNGSSKNNEAIMQNSNKDSSLKENSKKEESNVTNSKRNSKGSGNIWGILI